jgi:hypothetical protein
MNAAKHPDVVRETDRARDRRAPPSAYDAPPDRPSDKRTAPWNPVGSRDTDDGTFDFFVDGAGI